MLFYVMPDVSGMKGHKPSIRTIILNVRDCKFQLVAQCLFSVKFFLQWWCSAANLLRHLQSFYMN